MTKLFRLAIPFPKWNDAVRAAGLEPPQVEGAGPRTSELLKRLGRNGAKKAGSPFRGAGLSARGKT